MFSLIANQFILPDNSKFKQKRALFSYDDTFREEEKDIQRLNFDWFVLEHSQRHIKI